MASFGQHSHPTNMSQEPRMIMNPASVQRRIHSTELLSEYSRMPQDGLYKTVPINERPRTLYYTFSDRRSHREQSDLPSSPSVASGLHEGDKQQNIILGSLSAVKSPKTDCLYGTQPTEVLRRGLRLMQSNLGGGL